MSTAEPTPAPPRPRPTPAPTPFLRRRGVAAAFFIGLFLLLCALRMPFADRPIRDVDESVSALIATSWLEGGVPYRDAIDQRGPVTYAVYAAVFAVAGKNDMLAVHWALLFLILAGSALLFRFGRELGGALGLGAPDDPAAGYLAALLFAVSSFTYRRSQMLAFHTEWPVVIFSTVGMLLVWRVLVRDGRPGRLLLAGLAFGAAFLSKQPAVFDGAAAGAFLLAWQARERRLLTRQTALRAGALAGGFFLALGACVAYFAAHGALADFYLYFWSYNVEHYTAVIPVSERLAGLNPFLFRRHLLTANPLLLAAAAAAIVQTFAGWVQRGRGVVDARLLLTLWFLGAYFGASFSGRNFGHYFIQILCPACLLAALLLRQLWHLAGALAPGGAPWVPTAVRALLVAAVVAGLAQPLYRFRGDMAILDLGDPAPPKPAQDAVVAYVTEHTAPDDRIFVWGYNPEIYLLADRRPATRYSNTNYLTGMLPWENHHRGVDTSEHVVPGAWDILLRELEQTPPLLVIDTVPGNHRYYEKYPITDFPRLADLLRQSYTPTATIPDEKGRPYYRVYRRRV